MTGEIGFSSLGLPLFGKDAEPRERVLDALFADGLYDLLELHLSQRLVTDQGWSRQVLIPAELRRTFRDIASDVQRRGGRVIFGLGGRYLLDAEKHTPSLIDARPEARAARIRLLREAIELASEIGSRALIFLGGPSAEALASNKHQGDAWKAFEEAIGALLPHAEANNVVLAPEGHSKHIFATVRDLRRLRETFPSPHLGFTADVVHQSITEEQPLDRVLHEVATFATHVQLDNVTRESCRPGVPIVHTKLDESGAIDIPRALRSLRGGGYGGALSVEFLREDFPGVDALAYCRDIGAWLRSLT